MFEFSDWVDGLEIKCDGSIEISRIECFVGESLEQVLFSVHVNLFLTLFKFLHIKFYNFQIPLVNVVSVVKNKHISKLAFQ